MTLTLMAPYEDDEPESVFPATEKLLFIGGPSHGQDIEVPTDEQTWKMFSKSSAPLFIGATGGPPTPTSGAVTVETYYRRPLTGQESNGEEFTRDVFVHESIPNPQIAQQLLLAALLTRFIKGGRQVIAGDVVPTEQRREPGV